ncbi:MAG: fatty acid desaturase [Gemmatimonadetes bacterium]|nr:fatty acid desaturase [Gemmatimonadota bacterium]
MPGYGALAHPWWVPVLYLLVLGHLTNICVTLYLHRSATHGGVKFRPLVEHVMRFWLWLTTGMVTREWVAVHRKHHAFSDREGDPHSPLVEGFWWIVLGGVFFYRRATRDAELLDKYGKGCPDDWVERNVYTRLTFFGVVGMALLDMYLFGVVLGLLVWTGMIIWMPMLGNVINGIGHALGYRNFDTKDESRNIYPFGFWVVGEELHNNHHADPRSANFRARVWEFDIGWVYIKLLSLFKLADVIYARTIGAQEFAAKYYRDIVVDSVSGSLDRASAELQRRKVVAAATFERVWRDARNELDHVRGRLERARADVHEELEQARMRLDAARDQARAVLERARADAYDEFEQAWALLEHARDQARAAIERAKDKVGETVGEAAARIQPAKSAGAGA